MAANRSHHISKESKFQILIVPQGDAGEKRSFGLTLRGMIGLLGGLVVLILAVVILLLGYTPLGSLVPASNAQIQKRYGSQLYDLQSRLSKLSEEVIVIREYNRKLRTALGEDLDKDSTSTDIASNEEEVSQPQADTGSQVAVPQPLQTRAEEPAVSYTVPQPVVSRSFQASFPLYPPVVGYVSRGFDDTQRHFGIDYAGRRGGRRFGVEVVQLQDHRFLSKADLTDVPLRRAPLERGSSATNKV